MLKREVKRFFRKFSPFQEFIGICLLILIIALPTFSIFNLNAQLKVETKDKTQVLGAEGQENGISITVDEGRHSTIQIKDFHPSSSNSTSILAELTSHADGQFSRPLFTINNSGSSDGRVEVTPSGSILSNSEILLIGKDDQREYLLRNGKDGFKSNLIVVPAGENQQFFLVVKSPAKVNFDETLDLNIFIK